MQAQNQHLLQQVSDRDDYNIKLVSDSVKMKQTHGTLLFEKQSLLKQLQQVNALLEISKMKVSRSEEQMKTHITQAVKASLENRHVVINLDTAKMELVDAEKELNWLRLAADSSQKEYEQNQKKIAELKMELEHERNEREKLEEEYEEVKSEVMEMSSENEEATIQKLQDEIKECKAILKCGVCFDRPKEKLSRKLVHISIGMVFMLLWPIFSSESYTPFFAALAPGINIIRMLLLGLGIWKNEAAVKSISREGDYRYFSVSQVKIWLHQKVTVVEHQDLPSKRG